MARTTINDSDEGKKVVNANGDQIGMVTSVESGMAHVDPDPGVTDKIKARLGWEEADRDTYTLPKEAIGEITDDEIRLERTT